MQSWRPEYQIFSSPISAEPGQRCAAEGETIIARWWWSWTYVCGPGLHGATVHNPMMGAAASWPHGARPTTLTVLLGKRRGGGGAMIGHVRPSMKLSIIRQPGSVCLSTLSKLGPPCWALCDHRGIRTNDTRPATLTPEAGGEGGRIVNSLSGRGATPIMTWVFPQR
ncbi:hypothetical protein LZ31DRAFT_99194 [Colletotrichum somersetense]|nr:hypothetical protein LZ31DRAFT_99194 [Colletotrichum somersetense]